jgi:hypothetical protein
MKRAMLWILALIVVAGTTGCAKQWGRRPWATTDGNCAQATENGQSCDASCGVGCGESSDTCEAPVKCHRSADGPGFFKPGCLGKKGCEEPCEQGQAGPATGAVTYPYYTTRGPRDFLAKNPNSIGP